MSDMGISGYRATMEGSASGSVNKELADVSNMLNDLLPDVDMAELDEAMQAYATAHPNATKADVLEAVVTQYKPDITNSEVAALRTEWEQFTAALDDDPSWFLETQSSSMSNKTGMSVQDMMAQLMLTMIEVFGEEAANQLLAGFSERDTIMALAKEKAAEMRFMAGMQLACGLASAGFQIAGGLGTMRMATNSMKPNVTQQQSTAMNTKAQGFGQVMTGTAKIFDSFSQLMTGLSQAKIAELDGESQSAQIRKETAQKLEDSARDLITTMLNIYNDQQSRDYQNLSKVFNV